MSEPVAAVRGATTVQPDLDAPGKSSSAIHGLLTSLGWLPWLDATARLVDLEGAWLAPGGIVRKTARDAWPKALPVTTRIHAWRRGTGELWRLTPRFVDGTVLVTSLDLSSTADREVEAAAAHARHEGEVGAVRGASGGGNLSCQVTGSITVDRDWERFWVNGPAPVMFLRSTAHT